MNKTSVKPDVTPPFLVAHEVPDIDGHVGSRIHLRRIELSMSREDLAAVLGVSVALIGKYEHGQMRIKAQHLLELSRLLNCTLSSFFSDFVPNGYRA